MKVIKAEVVMEHNKTLIGKCYHYQTKIDKWTYDEFFKVNELIPNTVDGTVDIVCEGIEIERVNNKLTKHTYTAKVMTPISNNIYNSEHFNLGGSVEITEEEFNRQMVAFK